MEEGFWTAIFSGGGPLSGGGVVYLTGGKLLGGDSQFFYLGTYTFDPKSRHLNGRATVQPFVTGAISVFGVQMARYDLQLAGALGESEASIVGTIPGLPSVRLEVKLVKRLTGAI